MNDQFVDLRREHLSSEGFWPSFTDIMMVIVMIFLLTSMILMVRNLKLRDQLHHSLAAEKLASRVINNTSKENATLEEQLAQAQNEISLLRMRLMHAGEQHAKLETMLKNKEQQYVIVLNENAIQKNSLTKSSEQILSLNSKVDILNRTLSQLNIDIAQREKSLEQERRKIIFITQQGESDSRRLATLQDDYGSLKVKYDELIRPARTAKGKYVVSVNFEHVKGKNRIRFKDATATQYTTVSNKKLHTLLSKLKQQHPDKLYIKIIIPENSGLTYNEAWSFMNDLLDKYDYYSQNQTQINLPNPTP